MRYSKGPGQGFFWDVYGDHMLNVTMAVLALSQAHRPPDGKPYFEARIPLPRRLSNPDKDGG